MISYEIKQDAFTLAEVLITLGIIGVVAALTIPTLMANHRKQVVETRLAKFYSTINQAIAMSEVDNGARENWEPYEKLYKLDETGKEDKTQPITNTAYFNKYFAPYLKVLKTEESAMGLTIVYFPDGSLATFSGASIKFYPDAKYFKTMLRDETSNKFKNNMEDSGIKYFTFLFNPTQDSTANKYHYKKGVEPYLFNWDGTREKLLDDSSIGCKKEVSNERAYCTALIGMNGWKIPKDYPLRF